MYIVTYIMEEIFNQIFGVADKNSPALPPNLVLQYF